MHNAFILQPTYNKKKKMKSKSDMDIKDKHWMQD